MADWMKFCLLVAIVTIGVVILTCVTNDYMKCCCCYVMLFLLLADELKN